MKRNLLLFIMLIQVSFCFSQTIAEIQGTGDETPFLDQVVTTSGTVTAKGSDGYFIQDGTEVRSGIYVFDNTQTPNLGDNITITATVTEFFGLTELKDLTEYAVNSSGNSVAATVLTTGAVSNEDYEGMLVTIESATCTNIDLGFGEWEANDGSGALPVDDLFFLFEPELDGAYGITGIATYSFGNYKVEPRNADDILTLVNIINLGAIQKTLTVSPNPVSTDLVLVAPEKGVLKIFNATGALFIEKNVAEGNVNLDMSDFPSGMYYFNLNNYIGKVSKL